MTRAGHYLVAGLGSIGKRHARNLRALRPDVRISTLRRPESSLEIGTEWAHQFIRLEDAVASRPDGAIVAGPASTHAHLTRAFLDNGIPVLVEKPLAHALEYVVGLTNASRTPALVGYNLRFASLFACLRDKVRSGALGDILKVTAHVGQFLPDWRPGTDYRASVSAQGALGGGALLELSHELDYIYALFGLPNAVTCRGGTYSSLEIDVEDSVAIVLEYDKPRMMAMVDLDFLRRPASRGCSIIGGNGVVSADFMRQELVDSTVSAEGDAARTTFAADRNEMYLDEMRSFLAMVEDGAPSPIPLSEGIDVLRIIAAARHSMVAGRTVELREIES